MDILKDISAISSYRPQNGDLLKLFSLAVEKELKKEEIVHFFSSKNYFRVTYKKLKDQLLDGILVNSFSNLSKQQQQRFQIHKRSLEATMLINTDKKIAGIKIAEETFLSAEKYEIIDVALSLSRHLELLYSNIYLDKAKRNKYKAKTSTYLGYYNDECQAQSLFADLAFCVQKNQPTDHIPAAITALQKLSTNNQQFKFRLYYYSIQSLYARFKGDHQSLITICKEALIFFEAQTNPLLPYVTKWSFSFQLIPYYLSAGSYAEAENCLNRCLKYPQKGSYNWHATLFLKVLLGFYSGKPAIALQAYRQAHSVKPSFQSKLIDERWTIIHAFLCLLNETGKVQFENDFRLYRFLNKENSYVLTKTNLLVLELLHLLLSDKKNAYQTCTEKIEPHIKQHLNSPKFHRPKYFLRMLRSIELGDYHPIRVAAHAKKNLDKLKRTSSKMNLDIIDQEPVPYEWLWEIIMEKLNKKVQRKSK